MTLVDPVSDSLFALCADLRSHRFDATTEGTLQANVADALTQRGLAFEREVLLAPRTRIDFLVTGLAGPAPIWGPNRENAIGIDCKVWGPTEAVQKQVGRYCASERVAGVILISTVPAHRDIPAELHGKPVFPWTIWRQK